MIVKGPAESWEGGVAPEPPPALVGCRSISRPDVVLTDVGLRLKQFAHGFHCQMCPFSALLLCRLASLCCYTAVRYTRGFCAWGSGSNWRPAEAARLTTNLTWLCKVYQNSKLLLCQGSRLWHGAETDVIWISGRCIIHILFLIKKNFELGTWSVC